MTTNATDLVNDRSSKPGLRPADLSDVPIPAGWISEEDWKAAKKINAPAEATDPALTAYQEPPLSASSASATPPAQGSNEPSADLAPPVTETRGKSAPTQVSMPQFELPVEGTGYCALDKITVDPGIQTRAGIDDATVKEYAELLRGGTRFPPVTIFAHGKSHWLADGFHRLEAAKLAGLTKIKVKVERGDRFDAVRFALKANIRHGLRRTNADKRRAVEIALREFAGESDRGIAELCGVGNALVSGVSKQVCESNTSTVRKGRDGKTYPAARSVKAKHRSPRKPPNGESTNGAATSPDRTPRPEVAVTTTEASGADPASHRSEPTPGRPRDRTTAGGTVPGTVGAVSVGEMHDRNTQIKQPSSEMRVGSHLAPSSAERMASAPGVEAPPARPAGASVTVPESLPMGGIQVVNDEANLIPADKVKKAIGMVRTGDLRSLDDTDLGVEIKRVLPPFAETLALYSQKFPNLTGRDLSRVLGMANTRLQIVMGWL